MVPENRFKPDPAGIFACAFSLWEECRRAAMQNSSLDLSAAYSGWDELMRQVMRIGHEFEQWACEHVDFDEFAEVWPYTLEDRFGSACLEVLSPTGLASFGDHDCLRVALRLRLPIRPADNLRIPVDVAARNPVNGSAFKAFRIQTVRWARSASCVVPYTLDDEPEDEDYDAPFFGVYGITQDDEMEHITDRDTYPDAVELLMKLAPGIQFSPNATLQECRRGSGPVRQ